MKRILFLVTVIFVLFTNPLFSQETNSSLETKSTSELATESTSTDESLASDKNVASDENIASDEIARAPDFLFFTFGASAMLNAEGFGVTEMNLPDDGSYGGFKSAPSPIFFSPGIGLNLPRTTLISVAPHMKFSLNYYLWSGTCALPAEVEHRTAITPSIILDIPVVFRFNIFKSVLTVGVGASLFARYGFLAQGVTGDTVDNDVAEINKWFWSDLHYLYPMALLSWDYNFAINWRVGLDLRAYYPVANAVNPSPYGSGITNTLDTGIISLAIRITPPIKSWIKHQTAE